MTKEATTTKEHKVRRKRTPAPSYSALEKAQAVLAVVPRKSARLVAKTLQSAIANAENNNGAKLENLWVQEAVAGTASTFRRFTPKARGSAGPILKRNCHIKIVVSDESGE